jgi:hypothetical protein
VSIFTFWGAFGHAFFDIYPSTFGSEPTNHSDAKNFQRIPLIKPRKLSIEFTCKIIEFINEFLSLHYSSTIVQYLL